MPRYAYQRPVNRVYAYKPAYVNTYDKPATTQFTETKIEREVLPERTRRAPSEQPARRTLGEQLKTTPDVTIFRSRASSAPPSRRFYEDIEEEFFPESKAIEEEEEVFSSRRARARPTSTYGTLTSPEVSGAEPRIVPLWLKHPYRLPVEDEVVPPHESSIWPDSVPHFNLVSSYDAMVGYLGLKYPVY